MWFGLKKAEAELPDFYLAPRPIKDGELTLLFRPKTDVTPMEALWLSFFMTQAHRARETKPGSVVKWLTERGLIRHFEVS
jgi:hypothetical protein